MDHFVAAAIAEQFLELAALAATHALGVPARVGGEPTCDLAARRVRHDDRVATVEAPAHLHDARRQQALALAQRPCGALVHPQFAGRLQHPRDPLLSGSYRRAIRQEPAAACTRLDPSQRMSVATGRDAHVASRRHGDLGRKHLGRHPARAHLGRRAARHRLDFWRDVRYLGNEPRVRRASGIRGVEPVHVGQQHQAIRADHLRHARRETVVVTVTDLRGRHGVVLVDHGNGTEPQQRRERVARIEVTPSLLGVPERQQHLCHREIVMLEHLFPGVREPDLADRGGGLAFLQPELARRQPELPPAERDRTRRHQHDFLAARAQLRDILGEGLEPGAVHAPGRTLHQQRGTDLDDDPAGRSKARRASPGRSGHAIAKCSAGSCISPAAPARAAAACASTRGSSRSKKKRAVTSFEL